jgi:hypothetical protein
VNPGGFSPCRDSTSFVKVGRIIRGRLGTTNLRLLSLSHTRTHTHTHTLSLSLSLTPLPRSLSPFLFLVGWVVIYGRPTRTDASCRNPAISDRASEDAILASLKIGPLLLLQLPIILRDGDGGDKAVERF